MRVFGTASWWLALAASGCAAAAVFGVTPSPAEMALAGAWIADRLSERPRAEQLPFSFVYAGRSFSEVCAAWRHARSVRPLDQTRTQITLTWTDGATGLEVRCVAVGYADYPVVEWTLHFRNTSEQDTPILEAIEPLDVSFARGAKGEFALHYHRGDLCTPDSYQPFTEALPPKAVKQTASTGGRPTQSGFPYWNVERPGGGVIAVLSWAGQWAARFERDGGMNLRLRAGQERTHFRLRAAEEVRSPMGVVLFYEGDWLRGQNLWRAWMVRHNLPRPGGQPVPPMASICTGNYYPNLMTVAEQEMKFLRRHLEEGVRFDAWWQDAGWYPCDPVGWPKTGTWEVDKTRFPGGLRAISDFVHGEGAKCILWFEPERVHAGTWLAETHPEWVYGGREGGLLKLGEPECRKWLTDHIDRFLTEQGIDIYRQDFNIDPLAYWRAADAEDRQGISEIRHVEGYFAYWDELLRRHPGMFIDSCSSGGRRNDLETLRRAVPLLRSDYYSSAEGQQSHTYGLSLWFPFQGTAGYLYHFMNGQYAIRSSMVAEFTFGPDHTGLDTVDWRLLRAMLEEWRRINGCFYGDFYPLTPYSLDNSDWMAWQYDRPEKGDGCVQVFRRSESVYREAELRLRGLEAEKYYAVADADSQQVLTAAGRELMERGLRVEMDAAPRAALFTYRLESRQTQREP